MRLIEMKYVRMRKIIIDPNEFMIAGMTNEYVEIILDVIEWKVLLGRSLKMVKRGICPVCGKQITLTRHHVFKSCVWRCRPETQGRILLVCRRCHDAIEIEITRRENLILREYPDLYTGVVDDFLSGALKVPKGRKRRRKL